MGASHSNRFKTDKELEKMSSSAYEKAMNAEHHALDTYTKACIPKKDEFLRYPKDHSLYQYAHKECTKQLKEYKNIIADIKKKNTNKNNHRDLTRFTDHNNALTEALKEMEIKYSGHKESNLNHDKQSAPNPHHNALHNGKPDPHHHDKPDPHHHGKPDPQHHNAHHNGKSDPHHHDLKHPHHEPHNELPADPAQTGGNKLCKVTIKIK